MPDFVPLMKGHMSSTETQGSLLEHALLSIWLHGVTFTYDIVVMLHTHRVARRLCFLLLLLAVWRFSGYCSRNSGASVNQACNVSSSDGLELCASNRSCSLHVLYSLCACSGHQVLKANLLLMPRTTGHSCLVCLLCAALLQYGVTALFTTTLMGQAKAVRLLLEGGADIKGSSYCGMWGIALVVALDGCCVR